MIHNTLHAFEIGAILKNDDEYMLSSCQNGVERNTFITINCALKSNYLNLFA